MKDLDKLIKALQGDGFPEETILVCAGRAEGRRLLQQCAAAGACLVGVSVESPMSLAVDLCSAELSLPNAAKLISDNEASELILNLLSNNPPEYYKKLAAKVPAVAKELFKTFRELDMACSPSLSGSQKLDDTQQLRDCYQKAKAEKNVIDRTDLLKRACEIAGADGRRYVALSSFAPTPLEHELLRRLSGDALSVVPIAAPDGIEAPANTLSNAVPRLPLPEDLSARSRFYRCRGRDTEVRFLFRDILKNNTPVEDCAVIYPSGEYAQQIYETAARFHVPVAMSAGIPLPSSSLFAMLSRLVALPQQDYNAEQLCNLLSTGVFAKIHPYLLAEQLRQKQVGWGKKRYFSFLEAMKKDDDLAELARKKYDDPLRYANEWEEFFTVLFSVLEYSESVEDQKQITLQFLQKYTNRARPGEAAAYACAVKLISEISDLRPNETVAERLVELMSASNYLNSPAQPGQLFCVPLSQALNTGRQTLYFIGLSRYALQGSDRESPILSDAERATLGLRTAQSREEENTFRLLQAVLQHEGEIVFCYPDFDSERMLEQHPSPVYTDLKKAVDKISDCAAAPYYARWERLRSMVTYIPAEPLTASDHILLGSEIAPYSASWNSTNPAQLQPDAGHSKCIEDFPFSCSSLEGAFQCPLSFYLDKILLFRKNDVVEYRYDRWLPKNAMGTFCHHVLEKYYQQINDNRTPDLDALIREECEITEVLNPVTSKDLQDQDLQKARTMIENAIAWTDQNGRTVQATERPFGQGTPIDLVINNKTLHLRGSIDRVDSDGGKTMILDYKTGDAKAFHEREDYHLQHYLYTLAEEQYSGEKIDEAGYLFLENPSGAEYSKIIQDSAMRSEMAQKIENLLDWLADENKCMEWAPCLTMDNGQMKKGSDQQRIEWREYCSRFCIYKEFCEKLG